MVIYLISQMTKDVCHCTPSVPWLALVGNVDTPNMVDTAEMYNSLAMCPNNTLSLSVSNLAAKVSQ